MYDDTSIYFFFLFFFSAGFEFYESANGVILCPGDENGILPTSLFAKVVQRKKGKNIATAAKRQAKLYRQEGCYGFSTKGFCAKNRGGTILIQAHFVNYYLG